MGAETLRGSPVNGPSAVRINNAAASGDTELVAASSGKKHRVYGFRLSVAGATVVQLKDGSTVLEVFNFAAAGSAVFDLREEPYYTGTANTAFNLNSSNAVQVDGRLEYFTGV